MFIAQNVLHELEGKKPFVDSLKIKGERLQQEAKLNQDKQLVKEKGKMCCFYCEALIFYVLLIWICVRKHSVMKGTKFCSIEIHWIKNSLVFLLIAYSLRVFYSVQKFHSLGMINNCGNNHVIR